MLTPDVDASTPWVVGFAGASAVSAVVAVVCAIRANERARDANEKLDTTNALAGRANTLAGEANRHADEAVAAAREANTISAEVKAVAQRALSLQEDETVVRVSVQPRMMLVFGDGDDEAPRPIVKVVNLSAFPVTITAVHARLHDADDGYLFWKNPTLAAPHNRFPARLEPRTALTVIGSDGAVSEDDLFGVRSYVALTECGEQIHGMTEQWREHFAKYATERGLPLPEYPDPESLNDSPTRTS